MQGYSLPVAENLSHEVLSLPMGPQLTGSEVAEVAQQIKKILADHC